MNQPNPVLYFKWLGRTGRHAGVRRFLPLVVSSILAACEASRGSLPVGTNTLNLTSAGALSSKAHLFVENPSTIAEYTRDGRLVKTIKAGFGSRGTNLGGLAFDRDGNLYAITGLFSIAVYAPTSRKLVRTISNGVDWASAIATDARGDLYVGNGRTNSITVYPPGAVSPSRTVTRGVSDPASLAVDSRDNLYVANLAANSVTVYAPDGRLLRTLTCYVIGPEAVILNGNDELFVGNSYYGYGKTVTIYAPPRDKLVQILTKAIVSPRNLAVDSRGVLYVSNANIGTVTVYPGKAGWKLRRKISVSAEPGPLITDSADNLYVACYTRYARVNVYAPGSITPKLIITDGIVSPLALAIGPP